MRRLAPAALTVALLLSASAFAFVALPSPLFAAAALALKTSPVLSPAAVVLHAGDNLKFNVVLSNNQVWEKWMQIDSATGSQLDQQGNFKAGPNPGTVYVYVYTGDYGLGHPSIAQVTIIP
jgi:hypothetical protein